MQSATRTQQEDSIRYSAVTFRSLLDSLARPGKITMLEYPHMLGELSLYASTNTPVNMYALAAMMTLLDKEVTFAIAANGAWLTSQDALVQWVILRSGASVTSPENATFAFFCDGKSEGLLTQLSAGTLAEPEASTTAFYCVEHVDDAVKPLSDEERSDGWMKLELSGPGIKDTSTIHVAGLEREELQYILTMRQGYPLGVDVYLIDAIGRCVGLPRTTRIKG